MNVLKKLVKAVFWSGIFALLLTPLFCIYQISNDEMRKYDIQEAPVLRETAYGSVTRPFHTDMWETLTLSGELVSDAVAEMPVDCDQPELIHWRIQEGSEIEVGQLIGTCQGKELISTSAGIIEQICTQRRDACYLRIRLYSPLLLRCNVTQQQLSALTSAGTLRFPDGSAVVLARQYRQRNPDDTTVVELRFEAEGYSIGELLQSVKILTDTGKALELSGEVVSETFAEIPIDCDKPELIHWSIQEGSEIEKGQMIGTCLGKPLISDYAGIVDRICTESREECYLRLLLYTPLVMRCNLTQKQLFALTSAQALTLSDGSPISIVRLAHRRNPDGTTQVDLSMNPEGYAIGQVLQAVEIHTGRGYPQALVLDSRCVYQNTEGAAEPWYVRQVTEDGYFVRELEVRIGFSSRGLVCITGVETEITEDMYFDAGYKSILTGDGS